MPLKLSGLPYVGTTVRQLGRILGVYRSLLGNRFRSFVLLGLAILLGAGLDSLGIALVLPLVAALQGEEASMPALSLILEGFDTSPLVVITVVVAIVYVSKNVITLVRTRATLKLLYDSWQEWIESIVGNVLRSPVTTYESDKPGTLLSVALTQSTETTIGLRQLLELVVSFTTLFATYIVLWALSWRVTLVLTVVLGGFALVILRPLTRVAHNAGADFVKANKNASSTFLEILNGIRYVKAYRQEQRFESHIVRSLQELRGSLISATWAGTLVHPLVESTVVLLFCAVIILTAQQSGELSRELPFLGVLVAAAFRLFPILSGLGGQWVGFISKQSSAEAVLSAIEPREREPSGDGAFRRLENAVVFEHVGYAYGDRSAALVDVSLSLERGSRTALVGESGSGKSTLVSLLVGFLRPDGGAIRVDGTDLAELRLDQWRSRLGYVGQEGFVFNATLGENITLGRMDAHDPKVIEALQATDLVEIVRALPNELDTVVGERGVELSGGQRQRVALARAILLDPDILILDEATSALDNETAYNVMRRVGEFLPSATLVAVAHRLHSTAGFDCIYVLRSGEVVEKGTHTELMSLDGYYLQLFNHERMPEPAS